MQTCAFRFASRTGIPSTAARAKRASHRTIAFIAAVAFLMSSTRASAQYKPRPLNDPATGESWHIEASADLWMPTADIVVASAGSGQLAGLNGTEINMKRDLGVTDQRFPAFQVQLRPGRNHKLRFQYTPIKYTASSRLPRDIVFNGIRYTPSIPVNTLFDWKA